MRLLSVFAQCFLTGALLMAQGQPTPDGSIQARNKAVAMRVFDEIFNQGKFQVADEIYAPDFQNHGLHRSVDLKTDQEAVLAEKKAFPDLRMSVQEMVAEGDKVAVLWTFQGTHTGSGYERLPPPEQGWRFVASPFGGLWTDGSWRSGPASVKRGPTSECLPI